MSHEEIGARIYREARVDPASPPATGAVELVVRLLGPGTIYKQPRAIAPVSVGFFNRRKRILLREGMPPERSNFLIAWQLVKLVEPGLDEEVERAVAAWLVAPSTAFRSAIAAVGINLRKLARRFAVTETCAALRTFEVTARDGAVMTPDRVYKRGPMLARVDDVDVIAMTKRKKLASCKRLWIADEPGRVALLRTG